MNRTIKLLMLSDVFMVTGFGLVDPILAIFIKEDLTGGTIFAAGVASFIYLITKSVVQLPFAKYVDSHKDKVRFLIIGSFLAVLTPFLYIFSTHIYHIFVAQFIYGLGSALAYPTWLALWSTHLDKNREAYEWSLYSTAVGIGTAITATVGASMAQFFGFEWTFVVVGIMALVGFLVLFTLERHQHALEKQNK